MALQTQGPEFILQNSIRKEKESLVQWYMTVFSNPGSRNEETGGLPALTASQPSLLGNFQSSVHLHTSKHACLYASHTFPV